MYANYVIISIILSIKKSNKIIKKFRRKKKLNFQKLIIFFKKGVTIVEFYYGKWRNQLVENHQQQWRNNTRVIFFVWASTVITQRYSLVEMMIMLSSMISKRRFKKNLKIKKLFKQILISVVLQLMYFCMKNRFMDYQSIH